MYPHVPAGGTAATPELPVASKGAEFFYSGNRK